MVLLVVIGPDIINNLLALKLITFSSNVNSFGIDMLINSNKINLKYVIRKKNL